MATASQPARPVHYYLRLTSSTLGFPRLTEGHILNERVAQEELATCGHFTGRANRRTQIICMLVYFIYGLKNVLYLNFTLSSIDYIHLENNFRRVEGEQWIQFGCLLTNCSTDSVAGLANEMVKLPLYSICRQPSRWMYEPMMNAHLLGLVIILVTTYWVVLMCVVAPLYQMYVGFAAPTLMAIICPISSINSARHQIYRLWIQLTESFLNYLASANQRDLSAGPGGGQQARQSAQSRRRRDEFVRWAQNRLNKLEQSLQKSMDSGEKLNECSFISDSLPVNTNHWWISNLHQSFTRTQLIIMLTFSSTTIVIQIFAYHFSGVDYEFKTLAEMLQQNNCSLWTREDEQEGTMRRDVNVKQVASSWDSLDLFQVVLAMGLPLFNLTTALNMFHQCINDIRVLVKELEAQLKLAVEFDRLRPTNEVRDKPAKCKPRRSTNANGHDKRLDEFKANSTRQEPIDCCQLLEEAKLACGLNGRPSKADGVRVPFEGDDYLKQNHLNRKLAYQQLALDLLKQNECHGCQVDAFIGLLERIQINYWYLMRFIKQFNAPLTNVFILGYLLNYGLALVSVYLFVNIKRSISLPLVVIFLTVIVANTMIGWASSVHSSARKLEPLLWTLIARTGGIECDERLKHLRLTWIKQLELIDGESGLSLRVLNFRVTYVGIIQVLMWTSSIVLLAYIRN